ncbi:hypothetical protein JI739_05050 [Ramlibacter sp. AW1]|uniref:Uncharacterized protein n=1 Tax=Ramlibacter aurantiacus TaxID=2801330 RepID=A0A936ZEZ8_9BURK|nr:hypothetical protein [Ramlibacter aurantiacus]MBL0419712.1 hypothetical protein [Ramlibacter aurantiacus]
MRAQLIRWIFREISQMYPMVSKTPQHRPFALADSKHCSHLDSPADQARMPLARPHTDPEPSTVVELQAKVLPDATWINQAQRLAKLGRSATRHCNLEMEAHTIGPTGPRHRKITELISDCENLLAAPPPHGGDAPAEARTRELLQELREVQALASGHLAVARSAYDSVSILASTLLHASEGRDAQLIDGLRAGLQDGSAGGRRRTLQSTASYFASAAYGNGLVLGKVLGGSGVTSADHAAALDGCFDPAKESAPPGWGRPDAHQFLAGYRAAIQMDAQRFARTWMTRLTQLLASGPAQQLSAAQRLQLMAEGTAVMIRALGGPQFDASDLSLVLRGLSHLIRSSGRDLSFIHQALVAMQSGLVQGICDGALHPRFVKPLAEHIEDLGRQLSPAVALDMSFDLRGALGTNHPALQRLWKSSWAGGSSALYSGLRDYLAPRVIQTNPDEWPGYWLALVGDVAPFKARRPVFGSPGPDFGHFVSTAVYAAELASAHRQDADAWLIDSGRELARRLSGPEGMTRHLKGQFQRAAKTAAHGNTEIASRRANLVTHGFVESASRPMQLAALAPD